MERGGLEDIGIETGLIPVMFNDGIQPIHPHVYGLPPDTILFVCELPPP